MWHLISFLILIILKVLGFLILFDLLFFLCQNDCRSWVSPEFTVLLIQIFRSSLSSWNVFSEKSFVIWVLVQISLSNIEIWQNLQNIIVFSNFIEIESLLIKLFSVDFQDWLLMTIFTQFRPHFLGLIPMVQFKSLAEIAPFRVHLRNFFFELFCILLILYFLFLMKLVQFDCCSIFLMSQLHDSFVFLVEVLGKLFLSVNVVVGWMSQLHSTLFISCINSMFKLIKLSYGGIVLITISHDIISLTADNVANIFLRCFSSKNFSLCFFFFSELFLLLLFVMLFMMRLVLFLSHHKANWLWFFVSWNCLIFSLSSFIFWFFSKFNINMLLIHCLRIALGVLVNIT